MMLGAGEAVTNNRSPAAEQCYEGARNLLARKRECASADGVIRAPRMELSGVSNPSPQGAIRMPEMRKNAGRETGNRELLGRKDATQSTP